MKRGNQVWRQIDPASSVRAGDRTTDGYVVVRVECEVVDLDLGTYEWFARIETKDGLKPCPDCGHASFREATQCCVCGWSFIRAEPSRVTRYEHLEEEVV